MHGVNVCSFSFSFAARFLAEILNPEVPHGGPGLACKFVSSCLLSSSFFIHAHDWGGWELDNSWLVLSSVKSREREKCA